MLALDSRSSSALITLAHPPESLSVSQPAGDWGTLPWGLPSWFFHSASTTLMPHLNTKVVGSAPAGSGDDVQVGVTERANDHIHYAHSSDCALE